MSLSSPNEQGKILNKYLMRWKFVSTHLHLCSLPTYTYESEAHASLSTIDHIMCPSHMLNKFCSSFSLGDHPLNTSDHFPLSATLLLPFHPSPVSPSPPKHPARPSPNWERLSKDELSGLYTIPVSDQLEVLAHCWSNEYPHYIEHLLSIISDILLSTSNNIPSKSFQAHISPGWGPSLKAASSKCNFFYEEWVAAGRPQLISHPARSAYKAAKKNFRSCLRLHNKKINNALFSSLDLHCTDSKHLFQTVKRHMSPTPTIPNLCFKDLMYEGNQILEGWTEYFASLAIPCDIPLNSAQLKVVEKYNNIKSLAPEPYVPVTVEEVSAAIISLPLNKATGPDNLANEHLIYGGAVLPRILSSIFNAIFHSGYIPEIFREGYIIPIPKGHTKSLNDPSNYRGITLLCCVSKVFEKILLNRLLPLQSSIHPLQGGFRPHFSRIHTAFLLQESIQTLQHKEKKAYVAFIDVRKAFDTVWHAGLMVKLSEMSTPIYILQLIVKWYENLSSAVLWQSSLSRSFPILQGVRRGAILSPLLYSVFVDELLVTLQNSGYGVHIDSIFCGALMYADDLALISGSPAELQTMLDIVSSYALFWRCQINAEKSRIMVFGEAPQSRLKNRPSRAWFINNCIIPECDEHHHLGILRSVLPSSIYRTSERCSAGRSSFYALNAVGTRFGCLHPLTSFRLYSSFCLPTMLYGCELWSPTKSELLMLERVHRKILRTIQGLPLRCNSLALQWLMGTVSITSLIHQKQLNFVLSFESLPLDSPHRLVFHALISNPPPKGFIPTISSILTNYGLPSLNSILDMSCSDPAWKWLIKKCILFSDFLSFSGACDTIPLSRCDINIGKPISHWQVTRGQPLLTRKNNFRIRLLVGCDGLEHDASRFRHRSYSSGDNICKLCLSEPEDSSHFIARCPVLSGPRTLLLANLPTPPSVPPLSELLHSNQLRLIDIVLGVEWIDDAVFQCSIIEFLSELRLARTTFLTSPQLRIKPYSPPFVSGVL